MNEFINFNNRGFLLPDGCKDLIDVLAPKKEATLPAEGLEHIQRYVARLLNSPAYARFLYIYSLGAPGLVILACKSEFFRATVCVPPAREAAIRQVLSAAETPLLQEEAFPAGSRYSHTLTYSFPGAHAQASQLLSDLLLKGYGLAPDAKLDFDYREKQAPLK